MSKENVVSIDEEIDNIRMGKPHVIILGAGASRATCLQGDKNEKMLPLMNDLVDVIGLRSKLEDWKIDPNQNFENIFSNLYEKNEEEKIKEIEHSVENYFNSLELPDEPTVYDYLVLSLRKKDLIATFNWDPLLLQAYVRNRQTGLELPELAFLHGNVKAGYCEQDKISGLVGDRCTKCGNFYQKSPLLYPVKKKDYSKNSFIHDGWNFLKHCIKDTIFGYSGLTTDIEAIRIMKDAWGNERLMKETTFITNQNDDDVFKNWDSFIPEHHYNISRNFYDFYLANHPRRTGEAYWNQYFEGRYVTPNPIPRNLNFPQLWEWFTKFKDAEDEYRKKQ